MCGPNRASILTGRSASFHGVVVNNLEVSGDLPTWPELLQKAGYRTGGFGKFHHTAMQLPLPAEFSHFGYDESVPTEDPKDGAYLEWIKNEHPEWYETALAMIWPRPYHSEEFKKQARAAYDKILKTRRDASEWQTMYPSPLPKELHQTAYITDLSIDFIRRHKKNHAASPFM
ncbi:MAG TPA: hypothetical protein DC049_17365, partial [Spirochaetia bacterium]|nr:hypothetical protein [Spirochaetia bacterium]